MRPFRGFFEVLVRGFWGFSREGVRPSWRSSPSGWVRNPPCVDPELLVELLGVVKSFWEGFDEGLEGEE